MIRPIVFFGLILVACTGCKKSESSATKHHSKIDACSLITKEEAGRIQNTTISGTKGSENADGNLLVSQCYYAATTPNASISLAVTQADPKSASANGPRDYWKQVFGRFSDENAEEKEKEQAREEEKKKEQAGRGREEEERVVPPKKIDGVGEQAYWAGNSFGGALYVLDGDLFLRISVGGPDDAQTKIDKSKSLAKKAISRL